MSERPESDVALAASTEAALPLGFQRCLHVISNQWFKPINVGDLVSVSRMSPRGLFKAFRRHTGESPGQALRRIRIERAKQLLQGTNWHLKVIAGVCGFQSVNTFSVAFRRVVGISPGKFRDRLGLAP
jgi:transcriptional regulator GlxA family with amidase domain